MASFQGLIENAGIFAPAVQERPAEYSKIYNDHCHRIYSLAFWMTDNELAAEDLAGNTFLRAFALSASPSADNVDNAFLSEVREFVTLGTLTLNSTISAGPTVYGNVKRVHLERAVVQLPATEKLIFLLHDVEGYEHSRISRLLGTTEQESQFGLHQARIRVRELVSQM
jgi:RNA polymerase sigma-70 factor, ECF subfamily